LVALQLEPGWELQRRLFAGRSLNHLYFAHARPIQELDGLAAKPGIQESRQGPMPAVGPRLASWSRPPQVPGQGSLPPWSGAAGLPATVNAGGSRAISLQVIPFSE
jgi:hypothetical protein